jgi:hypothetical protein
MKTILIFLAIAPIFLSAQTGLQPVTSMRCSYFMEDGHDTTVVSFATLQVFADSSSITIISSFHPIPMRFRILSKPVEEIGQPGCYMTKLAGAELHCKRQYGIFVMTLVTSTYKWVMFDQIPESFTIESLKHD